jgi:hypothetical protein
VDGRGVYGLATGVTGSPSGVFGEATGQGGVGVRGKGVAGVLGEGDSSGVYGTGSNYGVYGSSTTGVRGDGGTYGVYGSGGHTGVYGTGSNTGVYGKGSTYGVFGGGTGTKYGVYGQTGDAAGAAIFGWGAQAGYFVGNVFVEGTLGKSGGSFVIDHPQDPANRTLEHSFVEAPERLNVYRGNVVLDGNGAATVRLPRYFGALNVDYSYQLTPIGPTSSVVYIARKISRAGTFRIAGGVPGQEVCWQVTGARQDAWARRNPLRVERAKKRRERGKYLNPEAFGKPRSDAMHTAPQVPKTRRPRRVRLAA